MSKVKFEEDELAIVALFQANTRKDTIDILKDTFRSIGRNERRSIGRRSTETIASAISKLQMIEDKYYYSLGSKYLSE